MRSMSVFLLGFVLLSGCGELSQSTAPAAQIEYGTLQGVVEVVDGGGAGGIKVQLVLLTTNCLLCGWPPKLICIVASVALSTFCMGTSSAQSIGVFFDQVASDCASDFPQGGFTFYILAILGGASSNGLLGAELKLEGHRYGDVWFGSCTGASELVIGTVEGQGASIAFTDCQTASPS